MASKILLFTVCLFAAFSCGTSFAALPKTLHSRCSSLQLAGSTCNDPADDILSQLANSINNAPIPTPLEIFQQKAGNYNQDALRNKIERSIQEEKVFIFTFTDCPYCQKCRDILGDTGMSYKEVALDQLNPVERSYAVRAELLRMTGRTSLPAIWINGQFVGGCNDGGLGGLVYLKETGKLDQLLRDTE